MKRAATLEVAAAAAVGLVFGIGLLVSEMSNPAKVLGFLDLTGSWDPSLALVMAGAIAVGVVGFAMARRRNTSILGLPMRLPSNRKMDRKLALGAAIFGAGWGIAGFCPGPALVALGNGAPQALWFVLAMLAGMALVDRIAYSDSNSPNPRSVP